MSNYEIRKWIIEKLLRHYVLCKHHIDEDDLPKGRHPKYRSLIKDELREMTREGLIIRFSHLKA